MPRRFQSRQPARRPRFRLAALVGWRPVALFGLMAALFGAGYLALINASSSKGYEIRSLEGRISELKEEQEKLELAVAQEQAVQAVEKKVQEMGMVPTPKVEYVMATVPTVAKR